MKPGGSTLHSQELSNNPYSEPNHIEIYFSILPSSFQIIRRVLKPCVMFQNKDGFYIVRLLSSRQTAKLEDHSWSSQYISICLYMCIYIYIYIYIYKED